MLMRAAEADPVAGDVLTYQGVNQAQWLAPAGLPVDHGALGGLIPDDDHTQYALLVGRAGGQTLIGGTAAGDDLTLQSTSDATRGLVIFGPAGTTVYDEVNDRLGVGIGVPVQTLHVNSGTVDGIARFESSDDSANIWIQDDDTAAYLSVKDNYISLGGTAIPAATNINIHETTGHVGIGTATPAASARLEISTTTGALLVSRMTTAQRNALTAVNGMIIYNSDNNRLEAYENGAWISYLLDRDIRCRVYHNANQLCNNGVATVLAMNSERFDPGGMHNPAVNNSRITFANAGTYNVGGCVRFDSMTGICQLQILLNGATLIAAQKLYILASPPIIAVHTAYEFAATDFVELRVIQSSGGAINCQAAANYSPEFWAFRIE